MPGLLSKSGNHIKMPENTELPDLLTKFFVWLPIFLRERVGGFIEPWSSIQAQVHIQGPANQYRISGGHSCSG